MPPCVRLRESTALELLRPWQPTWVAWCGAWRLAVVKSLDAEGHYVPRLAELLSDGQRGGLMARQVPSEAFLYMSNDKYTSFLIYSVVYINIVYIYIRNIQIVYII